MATLQTDIRSLLADATVAEAMSHGVVMCGAETHLPVVAAAMAGQGIHAIAVPAPHGGPALTISDLDLLRAALGGTGEQTAGDVALEPMATVAPSATVLEATARMATLDVAHLLVGDSGSVWPDGILSSFDIVSVLSGRDPGLTRAVRFAPARPQVSATRLSDTTVGHVMHPGAIACRPDTPMHELAGRMADMHVHCIAVSGVGTRPGGDEHLMWGLVTHMDVIHAAHRGELATLAGELAATTPLALPEDATLERAATLMAEHDVAHVVAVGPSGLPSGVVSTLDVMRILGAGDRPRHGLIA
jgi:CBS domain-containing protein